MFGFAFRWIFIALGIFILLVFIVDKLVLGPGTPASPTLSTIATKLAQHQVRRVTLPAERITVELKDGTRLSAPLAPDRDIWPAIRSSGAEVAIEATGGSSISPLIAIALNFLPFLIMILLLLSVVRAIRRRS